MPHVTVTIAGRSYRMACDEGQEEHLISLGALLDSKIETLRGSFGEIGDMRLAVMAGIMVADELKEAKARVAALEAEVASERDVRQRTENRADATEQGVAEAIDAIAARIEAVAAALSRAGS